MQQHPIQTEEFSNVFPDNDIPETQNRPVTHVRGYEPIAAHFTQKVDSASTSFCHQDRIVLLTFDDNYVDQSINLILSILKYHPSGVSFLCLCPVLTEENQHTLLSAGIPVRLVCFAHTPLISTRTWPACSIFRLFSPWLLDAKIHKVLYLDSDILCCGNIQALLDAEPSYLALCGEISGNVSPSQQQVITKFLPTEVYCNSGVCVINLDAFRQQYSFDSFLSLLLAHQADLQYPDQDFLNYFFRDKTVILNGLLYNFQPHELWGSALYPQVLRNCRLIHFSYSKPWRYRSELFLVQLYLRHSEYPPMIRKVKALRWKNALHIHTITHLPRFLRLWLSRL